MSDPREAAPQFEKFGPSVPEQEFNLDPIFTGSLKEQSAKASAFCLGLNRLGAEQEEVFAEDVVTGRTDTERAVTKLKLYARAIDQFNTDPRAAELARMVEAEDAERAIRRVVNKILR